MFRCVEIGATFGVSNVTSGRNSYPQRCTKTFIINYLSVTGVVNNWTLVSLWKWLIYMIIF
jgi:hypothetical protein